MRWPAAARAALLSGVGGSREFHLSQERRELFSSLERFAIAVAALGHDVDHPGEDSYVSALMVLVPMYGPTLKHSPTPAASLFLTHARRPYERISGSDL